MTVRLSLRGYLVYILALGASVFSLSVGTTTFAQPFAPDLVGDGDGSIPIEYNQSSLEKFAHTAERGIKIIFFLLRPLLTIAGAAMDNSLIYGQAFHLTTALWEFRQMIRTFSNFALGFFFVGSIIYAFFNPTDKDASRARKLIKKVAIGGILINMSRWIFAALIDLSTITTVSLGGLPLYVLKSDNPTNMDKIRTEDIFYLRPYVNINMAPSQDATQDKTSYSLVYGCTTKPPVVTTTHYLPCPVNNNHLLTQFAPAIDPLSRENYKQNYIDARAENVQAPVNEQTISNDFCVYNLQLMKYDDSKNLSVRKELNELVIAGKEEGKLQCAKVDEIITKATGMTGPLFTLYGSLLGAAEIPVVGNYGSMVEVALEALIKMVFGLAIFIPLFVLAIAMVIRVVIIWVLVIFSPLLVLVFTFGFEDKLKEKFKGVSKEGIISLIFLPTFVVFAISISIVFLSLLVNLPKIEHRVGVAETALQQPDGAENDIMSILGFERTSDEQSVCYDLKVTKLCISESTRRTGANIVMVLNRLVINSFGIALMRMVVFFALKSNDFTKGVAESVEKMAKGMMENIPIIPLAGGVGIGALGQSAERLKSQAGSIINKQQQNLGLEHYLNNAFMNNDPETKRIRETFAEEKAAGSNVPSRPISNPQIPENTDLHDYKAAPQVYANQAALEFPSLRGKSIDTREKALATPEFVQWMQKNGSYDTFLQNRDKSKISTRQQENAKMMEQGLSYLVEQTSGPTFKGTDVVENGKNVHRYLYNDKLTRYTRASDKNGKQLRLESVSTANLAHDKAAAKDLTAEEVDSLGWLTEAIGWDKIPGGTTDADRFPIKGKFMRRVKEADKDPLEKNGKRQREITIQNIPYVIVFDTKEGSKILAIARSDT